MTPHFIFVARGHSMETVGPGKGHDRQRVKIAVDELAEVILLG